jgi:D-glycero-D-manno-heptose 1,7-bisphosphate phosphatase
VSNRAAFFDRDGTIIKDMHYLSDLSQVEIIPGIIDFCLSLQKKGFLLIVVTNQSGVARGFFDELFVKETHKYIKNIFAKEGVKFFQFYYCPHHPSQNCLCRKPSPGMLERAAKDYVIDLSKSLMFGDKESDIQAGERAGCKSFYIENVLERGFL